MSQEENPLIIHELSNEDQQVINNYIINFYNILSLSEKNDIKF